MIFSEYVDESCVEGPPAEKESNAAGKLIEDESRLEEDVKAVLEELLCAVQAQIDREKEPGRLYTIYMRIGRKRYRSISSL